MTLEKKPFESSVVKRGNAQLVIGIFLFTSIVFFSVGDKLYIVFFYVGDEFCQFSYF